MVNAVAWRQLDPAKSAAPAALGKPIVNHVGLIDGVTPKRGLMSARAHGWAGDAIWKEEGQHG